MITGVFIVSVWVLDQDAAKDFYTSKLGCTVTTDIELDGGMRWLTVRPPGSTGQELLLMDPARSMLDADTAQQLRALVAKGALSPGVLHTDDCRGDYKTLSERGVEFTQPPTTRPYGIEAVLRDNSGNWYSFTQRTGFPPAALQFGAWRMRTTAMRWPAASCGHPMTTGTRSSSSCGWPPATAAWTRMSSTSA